MDAETRNLLDIEAILTGARLERVEAGTDGNYLVLVFSSPSARLYVDAPTLYVDGAGADTLAETEQDDG